MKRMQISTVLLAAVLTGAGLAPAVQAAERERGGHGADRVGRHVVDDRRHRGDDVRHLGRQKGRHGYHHRPRHPRHGVYRGRHYGGHRYRHHRGAATYRPWGHRYRHHGWRHHGHGHRRHRGHRFYGYGVSFELDGLRYWVGEGYRR